MSLGALQTIYDLIILSYLQKLDIEKKLQRPKSLWSFPETPFKYLIMITFNRDFALINNIIKGNSEAVLITYHKSMICLRLFHE